MKYVEGYLSEKDREVREEVSSMGDPDYVPLSERIFQEGEQKGEQKGKIQVYYFEMSLTPEEIAEKMQLPVKDVKDIIEKI